MSSSTSKIRQPNVESKGGVLMGEKLSDVLPSSSGSQRRSPETTRTSSTSHTGLSRDTLPAEASSSTDSEVANSAGTHSQVQWTHQAEGEEQPHPSGGLDPDSHRQDTSQRECQGEGTLQSGAKDGGAAECGQDQSNPGSDRNPSARAAEGDLRSRSIEQFQQQLIQNETEFQNLTNKIGDGLSTLKRDPAYVFEHEQVYKCH